MQNIDVWKAANILVDKYGNEAKSYAVSIQSMYKEKGNREGSLVWMRIYSAADFLLLPQEGNTTH